MGQRSQYILIAPAVKYGNDNPNDNKGKIYIAHNQWRYGHNAVIMLADTIKKLKYLCDEETKDRYEKDNNYFINCLDQKGDASLRYAENHRINWELSKTHAFEDMTKGLIDKPDVLSFLNECCDNNNGYFIIKLDSKLNISVGFLSGLEDQDSITALNSEQYAALFELESKDPEYLDLLKDSHKFLKEFKQIDGLKEIQKLKNKL